MSEFEHLLTRDGALSELTLMRHESGELEQAEAAFVEERLSTSVPDRRHAEQLRAFVVDHVLDPPAQLLAREPALARGWWRSWRGAGLAAVAAAATLILLRPGEPRLGVADVDMPVEPELAGPSSPDGTRSKGRDFDLRVQLEDNGQTRYGEAGSVVHPGERVQFTINPRRAGYVMVVGVGPDGKVYPAHPLEPGTAVVVNASSGQVQLAGALTIDEQVGPERFVGIWCPSTFTYADVTTTLAAAGASLPHFREGCTQTSITLDKRERGEPDPEGPDAPDAFDPLGNVMEEDERPRPPDTASDDPESPDGEDEDEDEDEGAPEADTSQVLPQ